MAFFISIRKTRKIERRSVGKERDIEFEKMDVKHPSDKV